MKLPAGFQPIVKFLPKVAMYLMMGVIMGFLYFYDIMPYFSFPASRDLPVWALVAVITGLGLIAGYLFPNIIYVLVNAIVLPALGAGFCYLIYMSPALSGQIVASGWADELVAMIMVLMPYIVITFLVMFITGFVSMYLFEGDEA